MKTDNDTANRQCSGLPQIWSLETLHEIATPELTYVADDAYHWTLIEIPNGSVRIRRNQYHHFSLEFIGPGIERPPELSGSWTQNSGAVRALRDYCEDHGWPLSITHISKDGKKTLSVNLRAL